ncbi:PepSY domain-containing protein [Nocardioides ochotonae]|uniref:PepSY domain-containing protein n=1 Tax=Nocardioides ochotonae TaxID=2685869 RepID=UPI00140E365D|nr:PepSY domain-containing protein [Nocardioides ochotonae]
MRRTAAAAVLGAVLAMGLSACGDDDSVSQEDRDRASEAALEEVGEGRVTEVEKGDGDDPYAFAVEVTLDNGEDVEIQLDEDFEVLNPRR